MTLPMWATTDDVKTYTGSEVTTDQLTQASATIDMAAKRTIDDITRIGARDQYWLKLALCYQAAWMAAQPDMFTRMDIDALGQSRSMTHFLPNAMVLGPNAKKALKCVSWLKSRSLHVQSSFTDGVGVLGTDPLSSASDDLYPWSQVE